MSYPIDAKDNALQAETFSPKIPAISKREPTVTNSTTRRDSVGSTKLGGSTASSFDESHSLDEINLRTKFINTTSLGRDD